MITAQQAMHTVIKQQLTSNPNVTLHQINIQYISNEARLYQNIFNPDVDVASWSVYEIYANVHYNAVEYLHKFAKLFQTIGAGTLKSSISSLGMWSLEFVLSHEYDWDQDHDALKCDAIPGLLKFRLAYFQHLRSINVIKYITEVSNDPTFSRIMTGDKSSLDPMFKQIIGLD